jgi:uncharacterized membrane protein SpoIIM required for sporulation/ABC-type transport system involved in multi-copper enzyme maturation permease subunit
MIKKWMEEFHYVWLVAWRELRDQLRDWRIIVPMVLLTLVLPFLANAGAQAAIEFTASYDTPLIGERLVPFLLLVVGFFPITVSLVIALEAFVGEKERGTIEPLLASPLKDWHIYMGKLMAGTVAPLITSYLGITVYLIGLAVQDIPFPDANRMAQTIILTTVQGFLMVSGAILISTQSTSVRAANLMSSFIVIPMALLIQGEAVMLFWGNDQVLWLAVLGVAILTVLLARVGIAHFQREALLGREIDILNLRWIGRVFARSFRGNARSPWAWYRMAVGPTLRKQGATILVTLLLGIISILVGFAVVQSNSGSIPDDLMGELSSIIPSGVDSPLETGLSFSYIFSHNLRAVVVIAVLGMVSFGTLGALMYFINSAVIGIVLALMGVVGLSPWSVALFGILPHGIFEITALILSSAAVLHGAILLVTPSPQRSLGEVVIDTIADWAKIFFGLVLPLLLVAAAVETWVTPVLLSNIIK